MVQAGEIDARSLTVRFGTGPDVLQSIDFVAAAGSFTAIVGPSGCGKSTLLRCVAGLTQPTSGTLHVAGGETGCRRGFVFQDATLLPWRNVLQNIALPLELGRVPRSDRLRRVRETFQLTGLSERDAVKLPSALSGGMRMRVSLARALVTRPHVLLLDEPFAALDDMLRSQLHEELLRLWMAQTWTTLFVTHNVVEAVFLSQRVIVLTSQPGTIAAEMQVPFDYPRAVTLRTTAAFAELTGRVFRALRG